MANENGLVDLRIENDVAYLTLNSPPLNILTCAMMREVCGALETVAGDDTLKALAVSANGKAFSAGADVGEHKPERAPDLIRDFSRMFRLFGALEIPVVMAVDGTAMGAGFELVLAADVLLATERAKFGQPEILLAFFAPVGVAYLPALVGKAKAMEITCSGRTYSAAEMKEYGLVTRVVGEEDLASEMEAVLKDFRKVSPKILRLNVRTLKQVMDKPFEEARLAAEKVFLEELMATEDVREGIAAFFEKRRPEWKNR